MVAKHYLFAGHAFWGHMRPAIALCAGLQGADHDILITLLIPSMLAKPASMELQRYPFDWSRLRVINVSEKESHMDGLTKLNELVSSIQEMVSVLQDAFRKLIAHEPLVDSVTKEEILPFEEPIKVAIIDVGYAGFALGFLKAIAAEARANIKFIMHAPLSAPWGMWAMTQDSPGSYMSYMDRSKKILASVHPSDTTNVVYEELLGNNDELIHIPGNTPAYVYELQPNQYDEFPAIMVPITSGLHQWDGQILIWPSVLGKEYQEYWKKRGLDIMQVGPQLPPLANSDVNFDVNGYGPHTKAFLDAALEIDGPHSVLYISFGSLFFCPTKAQIEIMLDVLNELGVRYIFVDGSAPEDVKAVLVNKVETSNGRGLLVRWTQQYAVLAHPATGLFLSHGGSNSFLEAIHMRTPLVLWPGSCDQVQTSSAASELYGCAYELLQIRNGYNIGRKTARGPTVHGTEAAIRAEFMEVFGGMRGELGARLRHGMERLADEVDRDSSSGESWQAMRRLLTL